MARLLCISDSFNAMTSIRSYKIKKDVHKAIEILKEEVALQYDPQLVPVFIKIIYDGIVKVSD